VGEASLARAQRLAERFGDWALVASRPVPVLAEASAVLAGMLQTPWPRFAVLSAAANLGISLVYAFAGAYARQWDSFLVAFAAALLLPGVAMWFARRWQ
jgi:membrane protein DedA with SNARE-associated domain